ncbi:hypothetical protein HYPSUDRAFT_816619 [Hypholoma sublateritium FD-334 SS-4]|uniref:Uncharacterized protein n=1 Tax=Hypholoma sublateritium (strain FD-334 SS-4) TaxID=945553 RepID=A0A0D2MAE1_HYPSF|nr:hypothetical protein HYPSUDRAFT_816619 [Hypholoma sublateritium FD-334 SS-4]
MHKAKKGPLYAVSGAAAVVRGILLNQTRRRRRCCDAGTRNPRPTENIEYCRKQIFTPIQSSSVCVLCCCGRESTSRLDIGKSSTTGTVHYLDGFRRPCTSDEGAFSKQLIDSLVGFGLLMRSKKSRTCRGYTRKWAGVPGIGNDSEGSLLLHARVLQTGGLTCSSRRGVGTRADALHLLDPVRG